MRTDAASNRSALLEAAEAAFAEHGLDVSLNEIARRAGVGNATLYRHFRDRSALVAELFERQLRRYCTLAKEAADAPDPATAFREAITATAALQASNRALAGLLVSLQPVSPAVDELRDRHYAAIRTVVERAVAAGAVHGDVTPADVAVLLIANEGLIRRAADDAPGASARLVALWLEGVGAHAPDEPLPAPPTEEQMAQVLSRS
ncbi:TetR family transcriptional regulator [Mycolicibacterium agri]|uniref:TetR family transcriptional regulator n=1 Tax=Mycolicibacterium agri TaxID=36811 RepID=A0A2A7MRN1_MYCAG|nr:TetR/AcrR family transcriptional regulator [Mycolicibacterium agri]PEG34153.1 TetR family transcriptional regulator [Mycolicibacterium agri]GFG53712.1 TetR family transcriptional regulator [Mycolicibacterium agri]